MPLFLIDMCFCVLRGLHAISMLLSTPCCACLASVSPAASVGGGAGTGMLINRAIGRESMLYVVFLLGVCFHVAQVSPFVTIEHVAMVDLFERLSK